MFDPSKRSVKHSVGVHENRQRTLASVPCQVAHRQGSYPWQLALLAKLRRAGLNPQLVFMDNEAPQELKQHMNREQIQY